MLRHRLITFYSCRHINDATKWRMKCTERVMSCDAGMSRSHCLDDLAEMKWTTKRWAWFIISVSSSLIIARNQSPKGEIGIDVLRKPNNRWHHLATFKPRLEKVPDRRGWSVSRVKVSFSHFNMFTTHLPQCSRHFGLYRCSKCCGIKHIVLFQENNQPP